MRKNIVLGLSFLLLGCSTTTHISKLPKGEEFSKGLPALEAEYPDLIKFSGAKRDWQITIYNMPEAQGLIDSWGKPQKKGINPWSFIPIVNIEHPSTNWYWEYVI